MITRDWALSFAPEYGGAPGPSPQTFDRKAPV
jgi:hypothetical protein